MAKEDGQQINDLIFKELIKRGYSLEGNTRIWNIADSKLWYLKPEQSQAYLDLEDSNEYRENVIQREIDLINGNVEELLEKMKGENLNIIDLGCGDGKKAKIFVKHLKGKVKLRYCPVDISSYMVGKAIENVKEIDAGEIVEFQWNISDFENIENISILLRQGEFKKNLFLLLGNTLGNFEINELLYEIRSSMKGGDFLLIGNGLDNRHPEDILKSYNNEEVDEFLIHIPLQLGLSREEVKLGARFKNSRVELYYTLQKEKKIKFQDKEVVFDKGDQILVSVSYKYSKEDFIGFLNLYFDDVLAKVSEDGSYSLTLCKK
jgi:uncharacterized SAM-dependent methyltransferase